MVNHGVSPYTPDSDTISVSDLINHLLSDSDGICVCPIIPGTFQFSSDPEFLTDDMIVGPKALYEYKIQHIPAGVDGYSWPQLNFRVNPSNTTKFNGEIQIYNWDESINCVTNLGNFSLQEMNYLLNDFRNHSLHMYYT